MADIFETLGNNSELSKALYEIFGHIATSAVLKANEKDKTVGSSRQDATSTACKSVPVTKNDGVRSQIKQTVCDVEGGKPCTSSKKTDTVVDSFLGRPRYQWRESETDAQGPQRANLDPKQLFSIYVGHLPTDITQGELEDLFSDIGEVADSYVFPSTNGHSYTYGFVRFYTLEEAKDAVRERHLKVIGNNQINVELSSSTRRRLQNDPEDEGSSPLLQKEYPKGPRKTLSDTDEKQVVEKMKASLRRLNRKNLSSFGNYSAEETFENIKTVLKLLINYPMTLTDPSADRDEDKSSNGLNNNESKHQTSSLDIQSPGMFSCDVANQQATALHCQTASRLPTFALGAVNTTETNTKKPLNGRRELSYSGISSCVPVIKQNDLPASERKNSSLVNKVREFLDSSSGDDSVQPIKSKRWENNVPDSKQFLSASSTDDERHMRTKNSLESRNNNVDSRDPSPINTTNHRPVRSLPVVSDPGEYGQIRNSNDFSAQHYTQKLGSSNDTFQSVDERTLVQTNWNQNMKGSLTVDDSCNCSVSTRTLQSMESFTSANCVKNSFTSHDTSVYDRGIPDTLVELPSSYRKLSVNEEESSTVVEKQDYEGQRIDDIHGCSVRGNVVLKSTEQVSHHSDFTVNAMSECIPQYNNPAGRSLGNSCSSNDTSNSLASQSSGISSKASAASDTKLTSILGKDTLFQGSKDDRTQMNDFYKNSNQTNLTSRSYSLFPSPSSTQKELSLNNSVARAAENSDTQNSTFLPGFNDVLYPISHAKDKPSTQLYSQELKTRVHSSVSTNKALLDPTLPFSLSHDSLQRQVGRKISDQPIDDSSPNETSSFNKGYEPSPLPNSKMELTDGKVCPTIPQWRRRSEQDDLLAHHINRTTQENVPTPEDSSTQSRDLFPTGSCSSSSADTPQIVDHSQRIFTKNVVTLPLDKGSNQYSKPTKQSHDAVSTAQQHTALSVHVPSIARKGEVDSQAKNSVFSPCVQQLFDSARTENCRSITETRPRISNENGLKSPGRRRLAPSFSFSASQKNRSKTQTNLTHGGTRQNKESFVSCSSANKTTNFQSTTTTNDMINDSAIVSILNSNIWKATSDASGFDFGFDDNDASESTLVKSSEPETNLLSSFNPTDDAEAVKLKDHLKEQVLKLEEMQRILNSYPQRKLKRLHPVFDDSARSLELETQIHDAEILLQKKEEMSRARSNERELAYEKEMFHSANDNPLLVEFAREMRKESLRSEIFITELKYKILELKIEQYRREETGQT